MPQQLISSTPYAAQQLLCYPYQKRLQDWQCLFIGSSDEFKIKVWLFEHLSNQEAAHFQSIFDWEH